ncbi:MAG: Ig-like domain-containing protein [Rhodothermales bacterium]
MKRPVPVTYWFLAIAMALFAHAPLAAQPATAIQTTVCTLRSDNAAMISGVEVTAHAGDLASVTGSTDATGCVTLSIPVNVGIEGGDDIPRVFQVDQPYPNPTADAFTVPFTAGVRQQVLFQVYDLQGRSVTPLMIDEVGPGAHRIEAGLGEVAPGVYVYRFQTDGGSFAGTLVKIRGAVAGASFARLAAGDGLEMPVSASFAAARIVRFEATKSGFNTLVEDREVEDGATLQMMLQPIEIGVGNHAPVITPIDNVAMNEGTIRAISVLSSDADGDAVTLSVNIVDGAGGSPSAGDFYVFVDNGDGTGVLQLSPKAGDAGAYTVNVTATDGELTGSESFSVAVSAVGSNAPPVVEAIPNANVTEGETLQIDVAASDSDGDAITLTAAVTASGGDAATFAVFDDAGDGTGQLTLSPMSGDAGDYEAVITATDGMDSSTETFTISVKAVGVNTPPVIQSIASLTLFEGETQNVNVAASDADGDMLTLGATATAMGGGAAPAGLFTFTDNGNGSGVIALSPDAGHAGTYTFTATASDASTQVETSFTLTVEVNADNAPPSVTPISDQQVFEGENLQLEVSGSDPDGDALTISAVVLDDQGLAMGAAFYNFKDNNNGTGTIKFLPDPGDFGDYAVTITASDGQLSGSTTFGLTVIAPGGNSAPVVDDMADSAVIEGNTLTVNVSASDVNGDPLTLSAEILNGGGNPVGAGFFSFSDAGNGTGTLSITPGTGEAGSYTATITANDGIASGSKSFNLTVLAPGGEGGMIPLIDMGAQTYLGFSGGLYPNASNTMPAAHHTAGVNFANAIEPLDTNGNPSPNGKYVLLSVGMSNTTQEFCSQPSTLPCDEWTFMGQAAADPAVNTSNLVIVNGAKGGQAADDWELATNGNYNRILNDQLIPQGLSVQQVQVAWVKVANRMPTVALPSADADAYRLKGQIANIVRALKTNYPNLKMVFVSSRIYAGYAVTTLNPEPYAYESAFGAKWLIEAQIDQMAGGGVDPIAGDVDYNDYAWIGWGPYMWADGLNPRSDGLIWERQDLESDGTHPSRFGEEKVGTALLDFFKNSPQTTCWFLENGGTCQ